MEKTGAFDTPLVKLDLFFPVLDVFCGYDVVFSVFLPGFFSFFSFPLYLPSYIHTYVVYLLNIDIEIEVPRIDDE